MFTITTDRLLLVPMTSEFLMSTHNYASDRDANQYMLNLPNNRLEETKRFIEKCESNWKHYTEENFELDFAILINKQHIGGLSLSKDVDEPFVEIGWILSREYWGKGFALEAAKYAINYFLKHFHITTFIAHCDSQNQASYQLMEQLGMIKQSVSDNRLNKNAKETSSEYLYKLEL
ncbi:GNAT family N-acetyltransferase [Streptococcus hongkongensis]|nr:GNAT family acetyltransferase [Streptococcus uberis]